jgi:glycosyltransferase involved in cell wall biosynthesis
VSPAPDGGLPDLTTATEPAPEALDPAIERALARILVSSATCEQPPLAALPPEELTVVLPALALGGAERIVLDWASRLGGRYSVHLALLGEAPREYPVPPGVRVTRLRDHDGALPALGRSLAASPNPVCLCHLLGAAQRAVLRRQGAVPVPVLHNARSGWTDAPADLVGEPWIVAVSQAAAAELRAAGYTGRITVIRHLPAPSMPDPALRAHWRRAWGLPPEAFVVGMVGGVKPQKAYPRAVRIMAELVRDTSRAHLVILGGPVGKDGALAWSALLGQRRRCGLDRRVLLPGFVPDAVSCLPAFDVLLNTSRYEGLSIATLEALAAGLPVVASRVGGQGEVEHAALQLLPLEAEEARWAEALVRAAAAPRVRPAWAGFPAYRLWTLAQLAAPYRSTGHVLFVTANLNAGGAQRSLVNLASGLAGREALSIAVTGDSTSPAFHRELRAAGVDVVRSAGSRDAFDHAEALVRIARARGAAILVFWNVDPKVKLLVAKTAEALPALKLVDVSPGDQAFKEMAATADFQKLVAYGEADYVRRLDRLVLKFGGSLPPAAGGRTEVIPNGVRLPAEPKTRFVAPAAPRVVVSGRLAPSKFLREILAAMVLVRRRLPGAELHVIGGAEPRHAGYARDLLTIARADLDRAVCFLGPDARAPERLAAFDAAVVIGEDQGCPNACLEALAAGVPLVANNSGGTRELVIPRRTGWLVPGTTPAAIAGALIEALTSPERAGDCARRGCRRAGRRFSMNRMTERYVRLFATLRGGR